MIPKSFDYHRPSSISEALDLLSGDEDAKVLAGGQSLLALMKLRVAAPSALVDISRIPDLSYVNDKGDYMAIGALTTYDTIEHNQAIKEKFSIVNDAVVRIGDQQIRNLGTLGGSACHADPAADIPTVLLATDALFVIQGKGGQRVVPATDFFKGVFATEVGRDEILTEVRLPHLPPRSGSAYFKHSVRLADFAIAMAGSTLTVNDGNTVKDVRISIGAAGPTPLRALSAEEYLRGKALDDDVIMETAERAADGADPASDVHGSRKYRLEMTKVATKRSLKLALSRIK